MPSPLVAPLTNIREHTLHNHGAKLQKAHLLAHFVLVTKEICTGSPIFFVVTPATTALKHTKQPTQTDNWAV